MNNNKNLSRRVFLGIGLAVVAFIIVGKISGFDAYCKKIDERKFNSLIDSTWGQQSGDTLFTSINVEDDEAIKDKIVEMYSKFGILDRTKIKIKDNGYQKDISLEGSDRSVIVFYNAIGFFEDSIRFECKRVIRDAVEFNESVEDILSEQLRYYFENNLKIGKLDEVTYNENDNTVTLDYKEKEWTIDLNKCKE